MDEKLKPCPFCGGTDILLFDEDDHEEVNTSTYIALCRDCGARGGIDHVGQNHADAAEIWNRRSESKLASPHTVELEKAARYLNAYIEKLEKDGVE